jgi:TRAP-type C4-dicarboxylate transport system permease small subunit
MFEVLINILSMAFMIIFFVGSFKMLRESWVYMLGSIPWISGGVIYIPAVVGAPLAVWYLAKQIIHLKENIGNQESGVEQQ